jgi:hypothetical protein
VTADSWRSIRLLIEVAVVGDELLTKLAVGKLAVVEFTAEFFDKSSEI